ncbi:MAG: ATP-binding protein [Victivallales bacterium]
MTKDKNINPRKFMELAIEVMCQSIPEPRDDGKASPKVGAVLVKPDGKVETACRGELRHGDHAEYTILERKNRSSKLDGSILFATLEPCAPGARRHPKLGCAERIVLARIKEVWIGIQDPDPTVARKGIKYLENNGIKIHMFDRDLQDVIEKENRDFLKQANARAAATKKKPGEIVLSTLENKLPAAVLSDFHKEALEIYRERAGTADSTGSNEFNRRLLQQGLLKEENGHLVPTGFGILLFGKKPRKAMLQAGLLLTIEYPDGGKERKEFDEPAVMIPDLLEKYLRDKLPNVFDRNSMKREERSALPFEMLREAVTNALIHRDYDIRGAKCQLVVNENTVTIRSPGKPPPPITIEQLQNFTAPMLSRNPELHFVFARMGMAEEQGLGLESLRKRAKELALPLPRYTWNDPYLVLTIYRTKEAVAKTLPHKIQVELSKAEQKGWEWVATTQAPITAQDYADAIGLSKRMALYHLKHFTELGMVEAVDSGPSTRYRVFSK